MSGVPMKKKRLGKEGQIPMKYKENYYCSHFTIFLYYIQKTLNHQIVLELAQNLNIFADANITKINVS
ncbi:MAG TPA: hypothetical protein VL947_05135 [Cytophagales bacterium]|nr:hypothetical protein [Cytophagales bacterium]